AEQDGQMLGVVLASLIRSSCARATAGARVTPSPTSPPIAVPPPALAVSRRKSRRLTCIESSPLRSGLGCAKVMGMKRHVSTPSGGAAEELFGARGMIYGRFWEEIGRASCRERG